MNFSTRSVNRRAPTRSWFLIAEKASKAEISAATSPLDLPEDPNVPEALASTSRITVSSRSSTKRFTKGCPVREVTFQSIVRMSSPC
jgi:hypothetical protein